MVGSSWLSQSIQSVGVEFFPSIWILSNGVEMWGEVKSPVLISSCWRRELRVRAVVPFPLLPTIEIANFGWSLSSRSSLRSGLRLK